MFNEFLRSEQVSSIRSCNFTTLCVFQCYVSSGLLETGVVQMPNSNSEESHNSALRSFRMYSNFETPQYIKNKQGTEFPQGLHCLIRL
jgi:hypothetical protein